MLVALYARVSTTRQAENDLSIPDQLRQMREWCKRNGHTPVQEFVESGASATDDKRPVFQEMVAAASEKPAPFQAIIVHSYSRFFRDLAQAVFYERKLNRSGVKLLSITQQTNDDPSGELFRHLVMMFDEYQSKENAKHTLRGMNENARQGFFNGSVPPFGYQTIEAGRTGVHGRIKKKLALNPAEAEIVRKIFALYVHGVDGPRMGIKDIAKYLNERGLLMRSKPWRIQSVHLILSSQTYMGLHIFNKFDSRAKRIKDESEWIKIPVPSIIDASLFEAASRIRSAHTPKMCAARRLTSPNLLTGLLKCECGASMVISTGKGGRYRYYKCQNRISKGNTVCKSKNFPADQLETLVLDAIRQKLCTPDHIRQIIEALNSELSKSGGAEKQRLQKLQSELKTIEAAQTRLLEAVETGALDLDMVRDRAQQHKAKKESLLIEMAGLNRKREMPLGIITPKKIEVVSRVLRDRLSLPTPYSRSYLRAVLSEVRVKSGEMTISGSRATLAGLVSNGGNLSVGEVPSFFQEWRALLDLNQWPTA